MLRKHKRWRRPSIIRKLHIYIFLVPLVFWPVVQLCAEASAGADGFAESGRAVSLRSEISEQEAVLPETMDSGQVVTVAVTGDFKDPRREQAVARINEIRLEACKEGLVDPRDGDELTMEDYVPVEWSEAMEEIAVTRAAEASVLQDHVRPNGESCFTVNAEVDLSSAQTGGAEGTMDVSRMISADMEALAWGYGDVLDSIEGWYSEKEAYLASEGGEAGHYIALISPDVLYFGAADFTAYGQRDACAGEFSCSSDAGNTLEDEGKSKVRNESASEDPGEKALEIEVSVEKLGGICDRAIQMSAERIADRAAQIMPGRRKQ